MRDLNSLWGQEHASSLQSLAKRVHGLPKDMERAKIIPRAEDLLLWMTDQGMWPFWSSYLELWFQRPLIFRRPSSLISKLYGSPIYQDPICFARASIHSFDVKTLSFSPTTNPSSNLPATFSCPLAGNLSTGFIKTSFVGR